MPPSLTHLNGRGDAHMVDVAAKPITAREALAEGFLQLAPEALALVREGGAAKGDVLAVARVAAIQAAKRTSELIPLCHPLPLAGVEVVIVSSVAQARYREAKFNSWDKNDPKDASVILDMLKHGLVMRYVDPMVAGHHDLQELSKTYYQVSRSRTKVLHAIVNHHLPLYFPVNRPGIRGGQLV